MQGVAQGGPRRGRRRIRKDEEMRAAADKPTTSQERIDTAMVERLDKFLRANGWQFTGQMVTTMVSGLTENRDRGGAEGDRL